MSARGKGRESDARYRNLCRRLGFGMLAVTSSGDVEVIVKPPTTGPRRNPKSARGWSPSTAPQGRSCDGRQHPRADHDGLPPARRWPAHRHFREGPRRVKDLRADLPDAGKILLHNVYGWFDRAERGVYVLTEAGRAALKRWPQQPPGLAAAE
jgi:hypothetical protein